MTDLKVDLYTEITCPWCLIGQHRLDKVLAERFPEVVVDIEHHPVILLPDCPPEGMRVGDLLKARHGITDLAALYAPPEAEARASGLALDLSRQPISYPTVGGHTLIRLARRLGTQHKLAMAFSSAHFHKAQNISDPDVLADISVDYGFSRDNVKQLVSDATEREETHREATHSAAQGVRGVPHFVFGSRVVVSGGQSEAALATAIQGALTARAEAPSA
jgi:predicted DsbA family dithiol-disulfide isomerase